MRKKRISRFRLHGKQQEAWRGLKDPTKRTITLISGVQGGKTLFGTFALRKLIKHNPGKQWIVGAPSYKILEQSVRPSFKQLFGPILGEYNGKDECFRLRDGGTVWFRTSTDPDAVEGVPDCQGAWIDEAGKCNRRFWVNIEARLARLQGKLILTTTWYSLNWLYKKIWKPFHEKTRDDIHLVYFNSSENPTFPKAELERQKRILSRAEFCRKFLGEPSKPEGLIYPELDTANWVEPYTLPQGTEYYGGLDDGTEHPMALVVRAITPNKEAITVNLFRRSGLAIGQKLDLIEAKTKGYGIKCWYCSHERPDIIKELNIRGIPAVRYFESSPEYRGVASGIEKHGELIRTKRYKIFRGIDQVEDLEDEYMSYSWDRGEDDEQGKERPVKSNDDFMDAERYVSIGTAHLMREEFEEPKIPLGAVYRVDDWDPAEEEGPQTWSDY